MESVPRNRKWIDPLRVGSSSLFALTMTLVALLFDALDCGRSEHRCWSRAVDRHTLLFARLDHDRSLRVSCCTNPGGTHTGGYRMFELTMSDEEIQSRVR